MNSCEEGWWVEGPSADGMGVVADAAHSGSHALSVQAVAGQTRGGGQDRGSGPEQAAQQQADHNAGTI